MALKGTLKDFGIADILQLIGQQQKTGLLHLKSRGLEVDVGFKEGNIVRAEVSARNRRDLIGAMLVRAEIVSQQRLDMALETQRRTLQRLGDVLVAANAIGVDRFRQMVQLQMSETLYGLFSWKSGTYEFEQTEVEYDANDIVPLRPESVLMEGFRMVDEWPLIRKRINKYEMTFERLKALDHPAMSGAGEPPPDPETDAAFDNAFGGAQPAAPERLKAEEFSDFERKVFELVAPGRDVRKLIDLSGLGEFETCKALSVLVQREWLKGISPSGRTASLEVGASFVSRVGGVAGRVVVTALVLAGGALVATQMGVSSMGLVGAPASAAADPATQRFIARQQLARIEAALDVYRLERGEVPDTLDALVGAGLLAREDLRYPWREDYYYRRANPAQFVLLPPLR